MPPLLDRSTLEIDTTPSQLPSRSRRGGILPPFKVAPKFPRGKYTASATAAARCRRSLIVRPWKSIPPHRSFPLDQGGAASCRPSKSLQGFPAVKTPRQQRQRQDAAAP